MVGLKGTTDINIASRIAVFLLSQCYLADAPRCPLWVNRVTVVAGQNRRISVVVQIASFWTDAAVEARRDEMIPASVAFSGSFEIRGWHYVLEFGGERGPVCVRHSASAALVFTERLND